MKGIAVLPKGRVSHDCYLTRGKSPRLNDLGVVGDLIHLSLSVLLLYLRRFVASALEKPTSNLIAEINKTCLAVILYKTRQVEKVPSYLTMRAHPARRYNCCTSPIAYC